MYNYGAQAIVLEIEKRAERLGGREGEMDGEYSPLKKVVRIWFLSPLKCFFQLSMYVFSSLAPFWTKGALLFPLLFPRGVFGGLRFS